jgi:CheY-like chemotaxis protein
MHKILIVEDYELTLDNWVDFFQMEKFEVIPCVDAGCAFEMIKVHKPDVVLCDIMLPDLDGFGIKARLNNDNNRTPVIFVSAHNFRDGIQRTRQLGGVAFLRKPVELNLLLEAVNRAIEFSRIVKVKPELLEPKAALVIHQGLQTYEIKISRAYTIGRSNEADIILRSLQASRQHGMLIRIYDEPDNRSFYKLIDLSTNGIEVNGKRITGYHNLVHGDSMCFPGCIIDYLELDNTAINPFATTPTYG